MLEAGSPEDPRKGVGSPQNNPSDPTVARMVLNTSFASFNSLSRSGMAAVVLGEMGVRGCLEFLKSTCILRFASDWSPRKNSQKLFLVGLMLQVSKIKIKIVIVCLCDCGIFKSER